VPHVASNVILEQGRGKAITMNGGVSGGVVDESCGLWIWLPSLFFDFQKKVKMEVGRGRKKAIDAKTGQTRRLRRKGLNASNVVREALCMDLLLAFLSRHGPGWRRLVASQVLQDRSRSRRDCWKP